MITCRRFWICGRVQGVFFRASTRRQALALGITGYARNLEDGRVEVLACGESDALAGLEAWLSTGPPWAQVKSVSGEAAPDAPPAGFETG